MPLSTKEDSNVTDEFMLKEYESIASAHFDSQDGLRQQFRFYLLIAVVPVTILGLVFRDRPTKDFDAIGLFSLPPSFGNNRPIMFLHVDKSVDEFGYFLLTTSTEFDQHIHRHLLMDAE